MFFKFDLDKDSRNVHYLTLDVKYCVTVPVTSVHDQDLYNSELELMKLKLAHEVIQKILNITQKEGA